MAEIEMMYKIPLIACLASFPLIFSGCFSMSYHQTAHQVKQQYEKKKKILEKQQDQLHAIAFSERDNERHYYLVGEYYIYKITRRISDPLNIYQTLGSDSLQLKPHSSVQMSINLNENQQQYFDATYTLYYHKHPDSQTREQKDQLLKLGFRPDKNRYIHEQRLVGQFFKRDASVILNVDNLQETYPIEISFYIDEWQKDGHRLLNNIKAYGITGLLDIVTLPIQMLMF